MNKEELYEILDIESGEDFQYFENFADLVESSLDFGSEVIFQLLEDIDMPVFSELCENYFDEMLNNLPDDQTEIYLLITNIKNVLMGLAGAIAESEERDNLITKLADEIADFKSWYCEESRVECKNEDTGEITIVPVRDALTLYKLEKLGESSYAYDFAEALDYELDEYVMSFADMNVE